MQTVIQEKRSLSKFKIGKQIALFMDENLSLDVAYTWIIHVCNIFSLKYLIIIKMSKYNIFCI